MTLAIVINADDDKRSIDHIIHLDATLSYNSSFQAKLTSNPIDGGAKTVNDHIVVENAVYSVKGIISAADFNLGRPPPNKFRVVNGGEAISPAEVRKTTESLLESVAGKFLPFGKTVEPQVKMAERSDTGSMAVTKRELIKVRDAGKTVGLIEFNPDGSLSAEIKDLVITSLQFSEDPSSGDVLSVDLTLQQATFVELKTRSIPVTSPAKTSGKIASQIQENVHKGIQTKKQTIWVEGVGKISEATNDALEKVKNRLKDGYTKDVITLLQAGKQ